MGDVFGLQAKINILYREDELVNRIELLHRWTVQGDVDLRDFNVLVKQCNADDVERDNRRKHGI